MANFQQNLSQQSKAVKNVSFNEKQFQEKLFLLGKRVYLLMKPVREFDNFFWRGRWSAEKKPKEFIINETHH